MQFRETRRNNHHQRHVLDSLNRKQTVAKETALTEAVIHLQYKGKRSVYYIMWISFYIKIIKIISSATGDVLRASNIETSVFDFFYLF